MNIARIVKATVVAAPMVAASAFGAGAATVTLNAPYGLAVDPSTGSLYIADALAGQIDIYNPASNVLSSFAKVANPFSLAVNSNGLVYAGIEGSTGQINVYNAQGKFINTLPTPPGDYPSTMTFDADNVLYESSGFCHAGVAGLNAYGGDPSLPYQAMAEIADIQPDRSYSQLQSYTSSAAQSASFALAYDNGQILVLLNKSLNVYEAQTLLSGNANKYAVSLFQASELDPQLGSIIETWLNNHQLAMVGSAAAATVDANHNIFYADANGKDIAVTGKAYANGLGVGAAAVPPKTLLTNLPSPPYGIAFDKARSRLYVAFPSEHLVRAYTVSYTTQDGVKVPALSMPPMLIKSSPSIRSSA